MNSRDESAEDQVILVDEEDRELGTEEKLAAHTKGRLHRAISVIVKDSRGRILLQRRAADKYHSSGLWSNACCTHPRPGEEPEAAAHRRLEEELGFDCPLRPVGTFVYRAELDGGLVEHEYDHVFVGEFEGRPEPNPEEVQDWRWIEADALRKDLSENPTRYTAWLPLALREL